LGVLEVLFLSGDLLFVELANEVAEALGDLINPVVIGSLAVSPVLLLLPEEIADLERTTSLGELIGGL
jgi:hypothetical protein